MRYFPAAAVILFLIVFIPAGCSTIRPTSGKAAKEVPLTFRVGDIVDTHAGTAIPVEVLMEQLSQAKIVYVGETHTNAEDHRVQLEILKKLYEKNPSIILAMEMFPGNVQPTLDRYWTGAISEEEFLKEVKWDKVWGYPFQLYRPIMSLARSRHIRIIALNAPGEIVKKVARTGISSLTPEERLQIAKNFHLDEPKNRARIQAEFNQHEKGGIKDFETFYEAQLTWEETMAETLAETLGGISEKEQILALIGKGHMTGKLGVPWLTSKRVPNAYKTIAPLPFDYPESVVDPGIADFVWITDKPESAHKGRLGLMGREHPAGEGLEVVEVIPGSPAEKAGFLKGDIIIMIDATPVKNIDDFHKAIAQETGNTHSFHVKRGKKLFMLPVTLSP